MSSLLSGGSTLATVGQSVYDAAAGKRALVTFSVADGKKQTLCVFDCTTQETYKYTAKATRLPVESGADITDHVNQDPIGIDFELMIVDSPLRDTDDTKTELNDPSTYDRNLVTEAGLTAVSAVAGPLGIVAATAGYSAYNMLQDSGEDAPPPRSIAAYGKLRDCFLSSQLLTVKTKLGTFSNMVIESLTVPRDSKFSDTLTFSISVTQINIVVAQSINASDVANARTAATKRKLGAQQPENTLGDKASEAFGAGKFITGQASSAQQVGEKLGIVKGLLQ